MCGAFFRPSGALGFSGHCFPPLKRWAILWRPCGTETGTDLLPPSGFAAGNLVAFAVVGAVAVFFQLVAEGADADAEPERGQSRSTVYFSIEGGVRGRHAACMARKWRATPSVRFTAF